MKVRRVIILLFIVFLYIFVSCSSKIEKKIQKGRYYYNNGFLYIDFELFFKNPVNFHELFNRFKKMNIIIDYYLIANDEIIKSDVITRRVKYNNWDDYYQLENSYSDVVKKYYSFFDLVESLFVFDNIYTGINSDKYEFENLVLYFGYEISSIKLPIFFHIFSNNDKLGFYQQKNNQCVLYERKKIDL